jgi:hypothetical protein
MCSLIREKQGVFLKYYPERVEALEYFGWKWWWPYAEASAIDYKESVGYNRCDKSSSDVMIRSHMSRRNVVSRWYHYVIVDLILSGGSGGGPTPKPAPSTTRSPSDTTGAAEELTSVTARFETTRPDDSHRNAVYIQCPKHRPTDSPPRPPLVGSIPPPLRHNSL